jgi:hypothetical protein
LSELAVFRWTRLDTRRHQYRSSSFPSLICRLGGTGIETSLWEIEALQRHYFHGVATLARGIKTCPEDRKSPNLINLDEFSTYTYLDLVEQEVKRKVRDRTVKDGGLSQHVNGFALLLWSSDRKFSWLLPSLAMPSDWLYVPKTNHERWRRT